MSEVGKASVWYSEHNGAILGVLPIIDGVVKLRLENSDADDFDVNINHDTAAWLAAALLHAIGKKESVSE